MMATIKKYTKKDGSTAYQFNAYLGIDPLTGKKKRTTRRGFKTQKEAKLALARLQLEVDTQGFAKRNYTTFKEVYELWYSQYTNTVKPITAGNTERLFKNHILPKFDGMRIKKITKAYCQQVVNEWHSYFSAINMLKSLTSKLFSYAVSQDIIETNPMQFVVMPKKEANHEIETKSFLELVELKKLLLTAKQSINFQRYLMLRVLAFTGMRKGELYALKWSDIDFQQKTLSITKTASLVNKKQIITTPKTKTSIRTIGIDDTTLSELRQWQVQQKKYLFQYGLHPKPRTKQLIFSTKENKLFHPDTINYVLRHELDTKLYPHIFRHTHASILFESGLSIKDVQKRLGHSNIATTMDIYTHVTKESDKRTMENINKFANF